jgi:hypothetical protein
MTTEFLKAHADTLRQFAIETSEQANKNPDDFWLRLAAKNQTQAAHEAEQNLKIADGSISLESFIRIADPLSRAWKAAAYRIRHGVIQGRIGSEISDSLNLKLAGIASGSTRILVTGNAAPDLSGENLLHATLQQTFRLLCAKNDEFYDAVDAVGGRAAQHFGEAMKAIDSAGLAAEFSWQSPIQRYTWHGNSDEIIRIRTLLAAVVEPETYEEEISGLVSGITDTGRLEIRTIEGKVNVRFPLDLTAIVQQLAIKKSTTIRVSTTRYWDAIAKKDVYRRLMIDLV